MREKLSFSATFVKPQNAFGPEIYVHQKTLKFRVLNSGGTLKTQQRDSLRLLHGSRFIITLLSQSQCKVKPTELLDMGRKKQANVHRECSMNEGSQFWGRFGNSKKKRLDNTEATQSFTSVILRKLICPEAKQQSKPFYRLENFQNIYFGTSTHIHFS